MNSQFKLFYGAFAAITIAFGLTAAPLSPAYAQGPADDECNEPSQEDVFPAGWVCEFPLTILACEVKDFKEVDDKVIQAGRAVKLFVTNEDTGVTELLHPRGGSLVQFIPQDDDTTRLVVSGVNLIGLFPTDIPAGPSTNLYQGRVDIMIDNTTGVWTVEKASGRALDICALLGG